MTVPTPSSASGPSTTGDVDHRLRVAFVGKGGAGKSSIAGAISRLLAQTGQPVLCLDSDPLPGLATSLGLPTSDAGIPDEAVEEAPEGMRPRYRLAAGLNPAEAIDRYADVGPDGVRFLQFGKATGRSRPSIRSQHAFRQIVSGLDETDWNVIGDLPAGTRQPFFGWAEFARVVLVVTEPTMSSMLSAKRLARLGQGSGAPVVAAIVNKVRDTDDAELVTARTGLPVWASVPFDADLREAERHGRAVVDHAPQSEPVRALRPVLARLDEVGRTA